MQSATQSHRRGLLALTLLALLLSPQPNAWTQYPVVSPPLAGSTPGANLRNAAAAVQHQVIALRNAAENWSRRAQSANYGDADFRLDYDNVSWQFQNTLIPQFACRVFRLLSNSIG